MCRVVLRELQLVFEDRRQGILFVIDEVLKAVIWNRTEGKGSIYVVLSHFVQDSQAVLS